MDPQTSGNGGSNPFGGDRFFSESKSWAMDPQTGGNCGSNPLAGDQFFSLNVHVHFVDVFLVLTRNFMAKVKLSRIVGSTFGLFQPH